MRRYNPERTITARVLRNNLTDSEQVLWFRLRRKQLLGVQFFRQKPLGNYVVDFYAPTAHLVIEVDGWQHLEPEYMHYDAQRTAYLEGQGLRVLRFNNLEVLQELEAVMETIYQAVQEGRKSPL